MKTLSYGILCNDEINELTLLLEFLILYIRKCDEVCVLLDELSLAKIDMIKLLTMFQEKYQEKGLTFKFDTNPLNKDFAGQKNKLISMCSNQIICNLDSDEIVSETFIKTLPKLIELNDIDIYYVPRINTVKGLTEQHIKVWGWRVNEKGWINHPDYQMRIFKNNGKIKWKNKVHEVLTDFDTYAYLPKDNTDWHIIHDKDIKKQEKQNNFYTTI